jgi:L-ascorbate metabolism protein UlaG (beta-lactamase superfamily)
MAKRGLLGVICAACVLAFAAGAGAHAPPGAVGGGLILERAGKAEMVEARQRVFGSRWVDPRTGAMPRDRVLLSWFGVANFAMSIRGKVVLLDAWVPRGPHSGYVPTSPAELAALRPKLILIGHAHFDHAADAVPIALASGARLVGLGEHCSEFAARGPASPLSCRPVLPVGAPPGASAKVKLLRGVGITALKHLHSAGTFPDGFHTPVLPFPSATVVEHPPTFEDMLHAFGHLPDAEGGSVLYRFRVGDFTLAWNDSSGPLVDRAPGVVGRLRDLGPVDVQVGAIQSFNQYTNGMRDPRTYIEALRPRLFVPSHHDDWALPGITSRGAEYRPYLDAELELIPAAHRPAVDFISDPTDYLRPAALRYRVELP